MKKFPSGFSTLIPSRFHSVEPTIPPSTQPSIMLSFNTSKGTSLIPSESDSVIQIMYLTIPSELDYIRP